MVIFFLSHIYIIVNIMLCFGNNQDCGFIKFNGNLEKRDTMRCR